MHGSKENADKAVASRTREPAQVVSVDAPVAAQTCGRQRLRRNPAADRLGADPEEVGDFLDAQETRVGGEGEVVHGSDLPTRGGAPRCKVLQRGRSGERADKIKEGLRERGDFSSLSRRGDLGRHRRGPLERTAR